MKEEVDPLYKIKGYNCAEACKITGLKRTRLIQLSTEDVPGVGRLRIGKNKKNIYWSWTMEALEFITNRVQGGYYL